MDTLTRKSIYIFVFYCFFSLQAHAITWSQAQELQGDFPSDGFSRDIAMSEDGKTIAVTAFYSESSSNEHGKVKVFYWDNCAWTQKGSDIIGPTNGERLGASVDISNDGNTMVVGSNRFLSNLGEAKVYSWDGSSWNQQGSTITVPGSISLGVSVSIDGDGDTIAVGELGSATSAYLYDFDNGPSDWFQTRSFQTGQSLGQSVKLSDDGNKLAMSSVVSVPGGPNSGQVRVYERSNNSWTYSDIFQFNNYDEFGASIDFSDDGNILVVSSPSGSGKVSRYEWDSVSWNLTGTPVVGINGERFGESISLSGDGNILIVGSPLHNVPPNLGFTEGKASTFEWVNGDWINSGQDINGQVFEASGSAVAISDDGSQLAVGGNNTQFNGFVGRARIFSQYFNYSLCIEAEIKAQLEGPSVSGGMMPYLTFYGFNPTTEPYTAEGYTFPIGSGGGETAQIYTLADNNIYIVDWVVLEIRDQLSNLLWAKSALLKYDGSIVDVDGIGNIILPNIVGSGLPYYLGVHHRNHVDVLAQSPIQVIGGVVDVDFTNPATPATRQTLVSGKNALFAGDATSDNCITASDRSAIWNANGSFGYLNSDVDMNGQVNSDDSSVAWRNRNICQNFSNRINDVKM